MQLGRAYATHRVLQQLAAGGSKTSEVRPEQQLCKLCISCWRLLSPLKAFKIKAFEINALGKTCNAERCLSKLVHVFNTVQCILTVHDYTGGHNDRDRDVCVYFSLDHFQKYMAMPDN